jgi:Leucine-rich repeat (LRR) protein
MTNVLWAWTLERITSWSKGFFTDLERVSLKSIQASFCRLTGSIPSSKLGLMTGLTHLNLQGNELTNIIPSEIGFPTQLENLNLSKNKQNGTIPTNIGSCSSLGLIGLYFNNLTGTLPDDSFGKLRNLQYLHLGENNLSGSLPLDSKEGLCEFRRTGTLYDLETDCYSEISCDWSSCCTPCY